MKVKKAVSGGGPMPTVVNVDEHQFYVRHEGRVCVLWMHPIFLRLGCCGKGRPRVAGQGAQIGLWHVLAHARFNLLTISQPTWSSYALGSSYCSGTTKTIKLARPATCDSESELNVSNHVAGCTAPRPIWTQCLRELVLEFP